METSTNQLRQPNELANVHTLGSACRELRIRADLTQMQLSAALANIHGFAQAAISRLESDRWLPDAGQMEHLLSTLRATESDSRMIRQMAAALSVRDADG